MKIIEKNKVYIQIKDLIYMEDIIIRLGLKVNTNIIDQCYSNLNNETVKKDYKYIKVIGKDAVDFFSKLDYIIDTKEFSKYSIKELEEYKQKLVIIKDGIISIYNKISNYDSSERHTNLQFEVYLINYKLQDFDNYLNYRKRILELKDNRIINKLIKRKRGLFI